MPSRDNWEEDFDSGVTSGPEEALRREIQKSKALKVERLKLRDEIEKLQSHNNQLKEENRKLKEEIRDLHSKI